MNRRSEYGCAVTLSPLDAQHVERHERPRDRRTALEHGLAERRESRLAVGVERDQLSVKDGSHRKAGEGQDVLDHVPAAAAAHTQRAFRRDDRLEPVPLHLVGVVGNRPDRASIGARRAL